MLRPSAVSSAIEASCATSASSFTSTPGTATKFARLPVPQCDGAGLVQQQHADIARGFHRPSRHGHHVFLAQPGHSRNPNGGEQRPDGRWDQTHQERDQRGHINRHIEVPRNGIKPHADHQKHQRQSGQDDRQRDFVGRLLAFRRFDHRDHPVEKTLAGPGGDANHQMVRQHAGSAGDRRAVAAALADDRCAFARDGTFIDRRHPFNHFSVRRNHLTGLHKHQITRPQHGCRNPLAAGSVDCQ